MKNSKHTPGPWEMHKNREGIAILHPLINKSGEYKGKLGGYRVVVQERQLSPEGIETKLEEHNARLITAAPDLLEACKKAFTMIGEDLIDDYMEGYDEQNKHYKELHNLLGKAIAKAEGNV